MRVRTFPVLSGEVAVVGENIREFKRSIILANVFFMSAYESGEFSDAYVIGDLIADSNELLPLPQPIVHLAEQVVCTNGVFTTIDAQDVTEARFDFAMFRGHDLYVWGDE